MEKNLVGMCANDNDHVKVIQNEMESIFEPNERQVFLYTACTYDEQIIKEQITRTRVLHTIRAGDKVLIKPNFVQESHELNDDWEYVITHPAVISAVIDIVSEQLCESGEIIIADAPMTPANFDKILQHMPVQKWQSICEKRHVRLSIIDLRDEAWKCSRNGVILESIQLPGDPLGGVMCDLSAAGSEFADKKIGKKGLYGASYNVKETNAAHNSTHHLYSVSRTVLSADVFINLPKMKTHKKGGITCCLKNLIGINTNKNLLPHHTNGTPAEGGDQFESSSPCKILEGRATSMIKRLINSSRVFAPIFVLAKSCAVKILGDNRKTVRSGGWYGNDTLWRTILDMNKVLFYFNENGDLCDNRIKDGFRYIGIVDGISAGEGNGPLAPDKIEAGFLLCGTNPVSIDCVAAHIMGFDDEKIPSLRHCFSIRKFPLCEFQRADICCTVNDTINVDIDQIPSEIIKPFAPALGWIGHIEIEPNSL
jgi:uncharacterized protein (DUF362 family)